MFAGLLTSQGSVSSIKHEPLSPSLSHTSDSCDSAISSTVSLLQITCCLSCIKVVFYVSYEHVSPWDLTVTFDFIKHVYAKIIFSLSHIYFFWEKGKSLENIACIGEIAVSVLLMLFINGTKKASPLMPPSTWAELYFQTKNYIKMIKSMTPKNHKINNYTMM